MKFIHILALFIILIILGCLFYFFSNEIISFYKRISIFLFSNDGKQNGELLKLVLTVVGGIGVFWGLTISNRRAKAMEANVINQSKELELSRNSRLDERFKNAIEHLADERESIIMGGIAELSKIAEENNKDYGQIVYHILNSFLKQNANAYKKVKVNTTIVQLIINTLINIVKYDSFFKLKKIDLSFVNLSSCEFENITLLNFNFMHCKFGGTIFKNCNFKNCNFNTTIFYNSYIKKTNFVECNFSSSVFNNTSIENSSFKNFNNTNYNVRLNYSAIFDSSFIGFEKQTIIDNWYFVKCELKNIEVIGSIFNSKFLGNKILNINIIGELFIKNKFKANSMSNINLSKVFINECIFKSCIGKIEDSIRYRIKEFFLGKSNNFKNNITFDEYTVLGKKNIFNEKFVTSDLEEINLFESEILGMVYPTDKK